MFEQIEARPGWNVVPVNQWSNGGGNHVLEGKSGEDFYISYQPRQGLGWLGWADCETEAGETAICDRVADEFYILNGDFREAYEPLVAQGLRECLLFYERNREQHGSKKWSTP